MYKRQAYARIWKQSHTGVKSDSPCSRIKSALSYTIFLEVNSLIGVVRHSGVSSRTVEMLDGVQAVSYTHLDVYKRQVDGGG